MPNLYGPEEGKNQALSTADVELLPDVAREEKPGPWGPAPFTGYPKGGCALALAREGLRVHPLIENRKKPVLTDFGHRARDAITDRGHRQIEWWWRQHNYNIGVATGPGGRIIVIDVDTKNGKPGLASLERLEREYDLPQSYRVKTPSGGLHVYLRLPPDVYVGNGTSWLPEGFEGIDIRGNAGQAYVVGAGSTIDGRAYVAIGSPADTADCPEKLLKLIETTATSEIERRRKTQVPACELDTPRIIKQATQWLKQDAPCAIQGQNGDTTTVRVVMCLSDMGVSEGMAFELLDEHWNRAPDDGGRADPPWDPDELEVKVRNGYAYAHNQPGCDAPVDAQEEFDVIELPDDEGRAPSRDDDFGDPVDLWAEEQAPPDLPPGLLPPVLEHFVTDEAERKGVERGAVALAALITCAAASPAGFQVQVKQNDTGHTEYPILWGALVGPPATRKTPVLNEAVRPLKTIEDKWSEQDLPKLRAYEREFAEWKKNKQTKEPEPERPRLRRKIVKDTTTEALGPILKDNPNGVLASHDELAAWIGNMDVYRPGKAGSKDGPFWLEAKQGGSYTVDRLSRGSLHVPRAAVHVLGGIQPDVIRKFASDLGGNGMLQRFMLVNMRPLASDTDRAPDEKAREAYHGVVNTLAKLHDSELVNPFRFSPEADAFRKEVVSFRDRLLTDPDSPKALQGWIGKIESDWARIALILHLVKWADALFEADALFGPDDLFWLGFPGEVISAETAEQAARLLMEWQYPHQRQFYQSITGYGGAANAHARNVAGYILARGLPAISRSQIDRNCSGLKGAEKHKARLATMGILKLSGWARATECCRKEPNKWKINPAVHDGRFKQRAEAERQRRDAARQKIVETGAARRECANDVGVASEAA